MARCNECFQTFSRKSDLPRHMKICAKPDALAELALKVARLAERVDEQDKEIQELKRARTGMFPQVAPLVFTEEDLLHFVGEGLRAFVQGHQWPITLVGKAVYFSDGGSWVPMSDEHLQKMAADVMKQLSALLTAYADARGMQFTDSDGRYLDYSMKVHGMRASQLKKAILSVCERV